MEMITLESIELGDSELNDLKDNVLMTMSALGLDRNNINYKHLVKLLENLFSVIGDRLDDLDGHKQEVSSLINAYDASRDKLNSSILDHLRYEDSWYEENKSLKAEIINYKRRIRTLEGKLVTQAAIVEDTDVDRSDNSSGKNTHPVHRIDVEVEGVHKDYVKVDSRNDTHTSSDLTTGAHSINTKDDDTIHELKREIIVLRIKLEKAESAYEDACSLGSQHRNEFDCQKQELLTRLSVADSHQSELMARNEQLKAELRNVSLELEELQQENATLTASTSVVPIEKSKSNSLENGIPLSEDLKTGYGDSNIFGGLADGVHVIEALNKKYHEVDSIISELKKNVTELNSTIRDCNITEAMSLDKVESITKNCVMGSTGAAFLGDNATKEPNVVFLGDSFLFGMREELASVLPSKYTPTTLRMTDATLSALLQSWSNMNAHPDHVVLSAGFVDVSYNELKSFKHELLKFCQSLTNRTRLIVMTVPFNYLLSPLSCVNLEIHRLNKFLSSLPAKFSSVQLIQLNQIDRSLIASKGMDPYYTVKARRILCSRIRNVLMTPADGPVLGLPALSS
uniref:Syntaxin-binding protein 4 n=1 Tax=Lygus hesperus TaxID=30085 RepID=A0A0A9VW29_LYGHE